MIQFPELFEQRTRAILGDEYTLLQEALQTPPPVSVRVNSKQSGYQPSLTKVPWSKGGYYLDQRPVFTLDPLLHAGIYYVQEASSMFLEEVVRQLAPDAHRVLDLCAAPGGKSTLLSELLPDALLVSNEIVRSRAMILAENLIKWGNPSLVVSNNAPSDFRATPGFFDLMVVDAPCSGEGMFRKDKDAVAEWSPANVQQCSLRQQQLLTDAWDALAEGGILIYSTCTFNREENEESVAFIRDQLGAELLTVDISAFGGIVFSGAGYRFYPHRIQGEGFFIAALRKTSTAPSPNRMKMDIRKLNLKPATQFTNALVPADAFRVYDDNTLVFALPRQWNDEILFLRLRLNCLVAGVQLAERKGNDLIPAHQLALSKNLNTEQFSGTEVDLTTALLYLKREAISLPDAPKGYVRICYNGHTLGWVKNLGNRSNNLYPQHWRIRMNL